MATTSTSADWSELIQRGAIYANSPLIAGMTTNSGPQRYFEVTATPEPPHECEVIQRMSEAYRSLKKR